VEIFLSPREFAGCKACAQVVESSWESFGQNVHESSRNLFCVMRSALIRSYAWKSTAHLTQKFSTGRHAATFSTNPQRSSQQQGSKFCFLDVALVKTVVVVKKIAAQHQRAPSRISSAAAISTAGLGLGSALWPLYFAEKRVQYASGPDAWEKPCPQQEPYARKANQWNSA
jgi:hypothetical protein